MPKIILPVSSGKIELTDRVACFLETGTVLPVSKTAKSTATVGAISKATEIETDFVCTEKHRAFFKNEIGKSFKFNVVFQKWLKSNAGKTYLEAIAAYHQISEEKKNGVTLIDKQFEYNTYIRDFFADNAGKPLESAILC